MAEPTPLDLIRVASEGIIGEADVTANFIRGADYESLVGPPAMVYSREARRDKDLFDATTLHTAKGQDLTDRVLAQFGVERIVDTRGVGKATLSRSSAAGGAGTIWTGTRILITGGNPRYYRTTADVLVQGTTLTVEVPIEAEIFGPTGAVTATQSMRLDDPLWDSSWLVTSLYCAPGTEMESGGALLARVRQSRRDARVGHKKTIEDICASVGASRVAIFRSNYGNFDFDGGLNFCYVGDQGYTGTPELVKACFIALRSARVLGDHLQVLPMASQNLTVTANVTLRDAPQNFDLSRLSQTLRTSVLQFYGGTSGGFTFSLAGARGAILRPTDIVQDVEMVNPSADVGILTARAFPAVLSRYKVTDVVLRYRGPV